LRKGEWYDGTSNASASPEFLQCLPTVEFERFSCANGSVRPTVEVADALAHGVLDRLVRVELSPGRRIKAKATYKICLDNASPLALRGLAVAGSAADTAVRPSQLLGISLPPLKHLSVPVSAKAVERLSLKEGIQILGADLAKL
jgi:hypothetical protein